jgi:hypothetical protein
MLDEPVKIRLVQRAHPRAATPVTAPLPHVMAQALCDLVEDPASGVTGVQVVGASPLTAQRVASLAGERGLRAVRGQSPSGDGGWVRISRRPAAREAMPPTEGEAVRGGRSAPRRTGDGVLRPDAGLRRRLRAALSALVAALKG